MEITELLGFLSYKIISTDGTLFPTNARYKGCTFFCDQCDSIEFKGIIDNVRQRVRRRLDNPENIVLGKEIRIKAPCPSDKFPEDVPRPKVEVMALALEQRNPENPSPLNKIFGLEEKLKEAGLDLVLKRGELTKIVLEDSIRSDSFFFRCPKLPSDTEARIGVRRNPQNPNKKEKIFGYNAIIDTSIELPLGIELPVACTTIAGNGEEGRHAIISPTGNSAWNTTKDHQKSI